MNPHQMLHEGLCNRLGLETLDIEKVHDLLDVEHELDQLLYSDINENLYRYAQAVYLDDSHAVNSPIRHIRQLKTKVNQIKNRTRRLTHHMSVRNIKNTPSAIAQKTKKGSKAIKEGWRKLEKGIKGRIKKNEESSDPTEESEILRGNHHRMGSLPQLDVGTDRRPDRKMRAFSRKYASASTRSVDRFKVRRHSRDIPEGFPRKLDDQLLDELSDSFLIELSDVSHSRDVEHSSPRSQASVNTI